MIQFHLQQSPRVSQDPCSHLASRSHGSQCHKVTWVIKEASKKIRRPLLVRTLDLGRKGRCVPRWPLLSLLTVEKNDQHHLKSSICHWNDASVDWVGWKTSSKRLYFRFVRRKHGFETAKWNLQITLCNCKIAKYVYIFPKIPSLTAFMFRFHSTWWSHLSPKAVSKMTCLTHLPFGFCWAQKNACQLKDDVKIQPHVSWPGSSKWWNWPFCLPEIGRAPKGKQKSPNQHLFRGELLVLGSVCCFMLFGFSCRAPSFWLRQV